MGLVGRFQRLRRKRILDKHKSPRESQTVWQKPIAEVELCKKVMNDMLSRCSTWCL